jgi:hypothetical protein
MHNMPPFARRRASACSKSSAEVKADAVAAAAIHKLDQEMLSVREMLKEVRLGRKRQPQASALELKSHKQKLEAAQHRFQHRLKKGQVLAFYQAFLKNSFSGQSSIRSMPSPSTLRKQAMLLFVSHQREIHERAMTQVKRQTNQLMKYMQCEIAVLKEEQADLEADFFEQNQLHRSEIDRLEDPLKYVTRVQQMVILHLQSLLQMQNEIRRHSLHYLEKGIVGDEDGAEYDHTETAALESRSRKRSSFENHDLNQSLSLVSATFEESFSKLEASSNGSPIPREKESMASITKHLLELDGTFPTEPEHEEYLEQSFSNILSIEHLWETNLPTKDLSTTTTNVVRREPQLHQRGRDKGPRAIPTHLVFSAEL